MRRIVALAAVALAALASGCKTTPEGLPEHCTTETEWPRSEQVDLQYLEAFAIDDEGQCHEFCVDVYKQLEGCGPCNWWEELQRCFDWCALEGRFDYLEAVCQGINAYRGEDSE